MIFTQSHFNQSEAEDDTIERFFICDSYSNSAILKACNKSYIKNLHLMPKKLDNLNININKISWGNNLDESNLKVLHTLSVIYDGMYQERSLINELFFNFNSVLVNLSQIDNLNEKNLCAIAHVYTELNKNNRPVAQELSLLTDFISSNTDNVTSSLCSTITNNSEIDPSGLYLKILYENQDDNNFIIFERCNNLNQYINNEMD
jgi:hypothetical protein